jgi:DNA-binding NtrC family response regulator
MADLKGHHALIIEDEMMIALSLEDMLTGLGFRSFDIANDAASAMRCARKRRPDMITADGRIIGGTGMAAVDLITDAMGAIPVIYVTGTPTFVVGRGPVVAKPFSSETLGAACARVYSFH